METFSSTLEQIGDTNSLIMDIKDVLDTKNIGKYFTELKYGKTYKLYEFSNGVISLDDNDAEPIEKYCFLSAILKMKFREATKEEIYNFHSS